jgi:hypothetical protein
MASSYSVPPIQSELKMTLYNKEVYSGWGINGVTTLVNGGPWYHLGLLVSCNRWASRRCRCKCRWPSSGQMCPSRNFPQLCVALQPWIGVWGEKQVIIYSLVLQFAHKRSPIYISYKVSPHCKYISTCKQSTLSPTKCLQHNLSLIAMSLH